MSALLDIVSVTARPDSTLLLQFENGERRVFDMKPLLARRPFDRIADPALFALASVNYGTVVWPGDIDVGPQTLYDQSIPA